MKIKKNDNVIMLAGKDKAKKGKVLSVDKESKRVTVEGLNLQVKHVKPKKQGEKGERIQYSKPVSVSSVALICPKCNKKIRVGYKTLEDGKKVRTCKKCQATF